VERVPTLDIAARCWPTLPPRMDAMLTFLMVVQIFVGAYSFEDIRNNNFADAFDDVSLAGKYEAGRCSRR